jgi:hypothetical protein
MLLGARSWQQITPWGVYPCHRGVVNEGCEVMGKPHPSHSFTKASIHGLQNSSGNPKQILMDEILVDEKSMFAI